MMHAFTSDTKYLQISEQLKKQGKEQEATNMCMLLDIVEERGIEKGINQGISQGIEQTNKLILRLAEDGRTDDIVRAAKDIILQRKLMKEYGLMND